MEKIDNLSTLLTLANTAEDIVPDAPLPATGLQVHDGDTWMPATREVWRSWTGLRAVWGQPWHGPVYAMSSKDDTVPWDGPRVCRCSACQAHVSPPDRPN